MELTMQIVCTEFEQVKIKNNRIIVDEKSEEYYIIPLNKSYDMESDNEVYRLTFKNQLLLLKYSNYYKEILIKDYNFTECVLIKSEYIKDIYVKLFDIHDCFRKNIWQSNNNTSIHKKYKGKYMLILPIIEDMIHIKEYGEGIPNYQVELITNEVLLKKVGSRSNSNGYLVLTNNMLLNKEALFVKLSDSDVDTFFE